MQPTDYPPGWQVTPHAAAPQPLPPRGTKSSGSSAETGVLNRLSQMFESLFTKQHSFLILSDDVIGHIFTNMTKKDLLAFTGTCMKLYDMRALFEVKRRFPKVKITQPLLGIPLDRKGTDLLLAANEEPLDFIYAEPDTQNLENEFYFHFKVRCMKLNDFSKNCNSPIYATVAIDNLNKKCISLRISTDYMKIKVKTIASKFYCKIFDDVLAAYASQPKGITPDSFKEKVAELKALLPEKTTPDIEAALRRATRTSANIAEIKMLVAGYLDPTSPTFAELKQALKTELKLCQVKTQAKIGELCGNNFSGTIHAAYCAMITAEAELNTALAALQRAFGGIAGQGSPLDALLCLNMANALAAYAIKEAHADLVVKNVQFIAAKQEHGKLCAELATLAVWTQGNITGGAIFEINAKLANLDPFVQAEATKLANFYLELSLDVPYGEEAARSAALHAIID